jgi:peptidoglycan hydrolase CwlO-like protein
MVRDIPVKLAIFFMLIIEAFLIITTPAFAEVVCSNKDDCQNKIKEYEEKLTAARAQKGSLTSQIQLTNTKVELAQVRIQKTQHDVEATQNEIAQLTDKIEQLNSTLDHLSVILLQKIVQGYKNKGASMLDVLLSPEASTLTNQLKYIQIAQENDRLLALRTQQVKVNFSEQKTLREDKKVELEKLEKDLEAQKIDLKNQVAQKNALLDQTKSDEKKYQQLLSQALAEFQAVNKAVETGQKIGEVKKGDPIALVGNTGYPNCSTGAHLHLEVRQNGTWTDPGAFLGKSWDWPLSQPIEVTQGYGVTPWSWRYSYSGGIHTGYDMVSRSSDVIRAVADGTLYSSSQNCNGPVIKIKYIDHGGGLVSFYLHVQ